ncbi:unnamed protein product, partial [Urochloa humidicola]
RGRGGLLVCRLRKEPATPFHSARGWWPSLPPPSFCTACVANFPRRKNRASHAARCRRPRWPASGSAGKERDSLGSGLRKQIEGAVARADLHRPAPSRAAWVLPARGHASQGKNERLEERDDRW